MDPNSLIGVLGMFAESGALGDGRREVVQGDPREPLCSGVPLGYLVGATWQSMGVHPVPDEETETPGRELALDPQLAKAGLLGSDAASHVRR